MIIRMKISTVAGRGHKKNFYLFIYFLLMISDEDFYGGRTGPLEKFYLFIYFLLMISDEDFYGGRTGPLEKFYLFIFC